MSTPPYCAHRSSQVRFRKTRPLAVVVAPAAVFVPATFFVSALAVPFLKVLITFFVEAAAAPRAPVVFFTTVVAVLPSLASLVALTRRPARVGGRDDAAAAGLRPFVAGAVLAVVVTFREAAGLAPLAFSTMLDRMLVAAAERVVPADLRGEPGRARPLIGDAGRSRLASREFEDVGDKTCAGRTLVVPGAARTRFLALSPYSRSFSLSPASSSLRNKSVHHRLCVSGVGAYLIRFWPRAAGSTLLASATGLACPPRIGPSLAGTGGGLDAAVVFACSCSMHFCKRSFIFILLRDMGMRLMRISILERSPCACI